MVTKITDGIKVSVESSFQPNHSDATNYLYLFSYDITIENVSSETVKLLRRQWYIQDANGIVREIEGEGVIGEQPVIEPGCLHHYSSACDLSTDMGKMHGSYLMERLGDKKQFRVNVPEFKMIVPHKLN